MRPTPHCSSATSSNPPLVHLPAVGVYRSADLFFTVPVLIGSGFEEVETDVGPPPPGLSGVNVSGMDEGGVGLVVIGLGVIVTTVTGLEIVGKVGGDTGGTRVGGDGSAGRSGPLAHIVTPFGDVLHALGWPVLGSVNGNPAPGSEGPVPGVPGDTGRGGVGVDRGPGGCTVGDGGSGIGGEVG